MISTPSKTCRTLTWVLGITLCLPMAIAWGGTFAVKIIPSGAGSVIWTCSDPAGSGVFTNAGGNFTYTKDVGIVVLTFVPKPGGSILEVLTDEGDETAWVLYNGNQDSWYGPSENSKFVKVTFAPPPDPTGDFGFTFPTNQAGLVAIADLTGNYQGVTPTSKHRNYNIDVAQDESGKLAAMGTVSGIVPNGTNSTLSGNVGAVSTVNSNPTAKLKGKFAGTRDGAAVSATGSALAPLNITDIGGGTNGFAATGSGSAKVAGVPYTAKNEPLNVPASVVETNLHKSWSLQLSLTNKVNAKTSKPYIAASAQLLLPNGDTIVYPERAIKYSTKTGYSPQFKGGTNTTVNPPVLDKKSKIKIKNMTLEKQGSVYQPTGGTISYQFLGQKGAGNLLDFVAP